MGQTLILPAISSGIAVVAATATLEVIQALIFIMEVCTVAVVRAVLRWSTVFALDTIVDLIERYALAGGLAVLIRPLTVGRGEAFVDVKKGCAGAGFVAVLAIATITRVQAFVDVIEAPALTILVAVLIQATVLALKAIAYVPHHLLAHAVFIAIFPLSAIVVGEAFAETA
jgi:hypothetical protein